MKKLTHNTLVRLAGWNAVTTAKMGTSAGMYHEIPERFRTVSLAEHLERDRRNGGVPVFATYSGASLSASRAHHQQKLDAAARAVTLEDGEHVEVEGAVYEVRVVPGNAAQPRNSDPVHFHALAGAAK